MPPSSSWSPACSSRCSASSGRPESGTLPFLVLGLMVGDEDEEVGVAGAARRDRGPRVIEPTDEVGGDRALRVLRIYHSAVVGPWRRRDRELRGARAPTSSWSARVRWNEGGRDVAPRSRRRPVRGAARPPSGSHPYGFVYDPRPIWRVLRSHTFDVIDVHEEPASLAAAEGWLLARLAGSRAALCLYSAQNLPKRYPVPFRWIERAMLRRAAGVHTCNDAAGDVLRRKGFSGVVRNLGLGVDVEQFAPAPTGRSSAPYRPEPLRVGYVGRLEPHKGVDVLIAAVAATDGRHARDRRCRPATRPTLERAVDDAGATARVSFDGFHDQGGLAAVYQRFDVVVVPSLDTPSWVEQFGRVAVEAMASGVAVVASRSGALPEVVGDAGAARATRRRGRAGRGAGRAARRPGPAGRARRRRTGAGRRRTPGRRWRVASSTSTAELDWFAP